MPELKVINGHTQTFYVQRYLEKNGRALAIDYFNMDMSAIRKGKTWSHVMDDFRKLCGTDHRAGGKGKEPRRYIHLILSPDPKDNVSLEDLKEYTNDFVQDNFSNFQATIIYHDDNENHIPHAHLIINNVNLEAIESGQGSKRIASWLTKGKWKAISKSAQDLAKQRNWHYFIAEEERTDDTNSRTLDEHLEANRESLISDGTFKRRKDTHYAKSELELLDKSKFAWGWKDDIRERVVIAKESAASFEEFKANLDYLDIKYKVSADGKDLVFIHPDKDTWKVKGQTLGKSFSKRALECDLKAERQVSVIKNNNQIMLQLRGNFTDFSSVRSIGFIKPGTGITLRDVARVLEINKRYGIERTKDYPSHAQRTTSTQARQELAYAQAVITSLGFTDKAFVPKAHVGTKKIHIQRHILIGTVDQRRMKLKAIYKARQSQAIPAMNPSQGQCSYSNTLGFIAAQKAKSRNVKEK